MHWYKKASPELEGRGIIIDESLEDKDVLKLFKVIGRKYITALEEHSNQVAFDAKDIDDLAKEVQKATKPAWYSALWNDEKAVIIFSDKLIDHKHPPGAAS